MASLVWLTTRHRGRGLVALVAAFALAAVATAPAAAVVVPVHITKAFGASSVPLNGTTSLTFTIANGNTSLGITNISFSDGFPSGLTLTQLVSNGCGGVVTTTASSVALSGAALPARTTCVITTTVKGTSYGKLDNSVQVTANIGPGNTSTASLIVVRPPTGTTSITNLAHVGITWTSLGTNVLLNIGLSNPNTLVALSGVGVSSTLPSGLAIANPNGLAVAGGCTANEISAVPGSQTLSLAGASLPASPDPNSTCGITVTLHSTASGPKSIVTGTIVSNEAADTVGPVAILTVVGSGPRVYWGTFTPSGAMPSADVPQQPTGAIDFARLDGSVAAILRQSAGSGGTAGTAIDAAAGRVYWIDQTNAALRWASLDDSSAGTIPMTGGPTALISGMAIDPPHGRIYWASSGANAIGYANYKQGTAGTLYTSASTGGATLSAPNGVALDPTAGRIYWADVAGGSGHISYADLAGTGHGADLLTTGATVDEPAGLVVDHADGLVFWANHAANSISYAHLDGSGGGNLVTTGATVAGPDGLAFDPTTRRLWWGNSAGNTLASVVLDATGTVASNGMTAPPMLNPSEPNDPSLLDPPKASAAPKLTGTGAANAQLTCSKGTWATDTIGENFFRAAKSYAYHWQSGGVVIAGATASTYTPSVAGDYTCTVTASNAAGAATSAKSNLADGLAPTVTAPAAAPQLASTLGSAIPVVVTWTGSDAGSGIAHYEVSLSTNGGAYVVVASPTSATYTRSFTPSTTRTYRFRVRAFDKAGNVSGYVAGPTFHVKVIDQTAAGFTWSGTWTTVSTTSAYGGSYRWASASGASVSYTFTGSGIGALGLVAAGFGSFTVSIDGISLGSFSEYATSTAWKRIVAAKAWTTSAGHTIKLTCSATSGHPKLGLDAFVILG